VIGIEGQNGRFHTAPPSTVDETLQRMRQRLEPDNAWATFSNLVRFHQGISEIEKPVVAKVNGEAAGFGSSIALACDLIYASTDALFSDSHLSLGSAFGADGNWGVTPGDGGAARVPLVMSPARAKEYLMLGRVYT